MTKPNLYPSIDGPTPKLSEDIKEHRWSLLSADMREIEQQLWSIEEVMLAHQKRLAHLEEVCEQCILEHQGRGK